MKVFTVNSFSYFKIRNNAMTMWNLPLALQLISGHWIILRLSIKLIILHCYVAYNCWWADFCHEILLVYY